MRANTMKARLYAGEPVFGLSIMIPSPQVVEMAAAVGFDWVLLDCEHGTLNLETVELMVTAADAAGIVPIARPAVNAPEAIGPLLDRGVMGLQVPHVDSADAARRAVQAARFYPHGSRGLAAGTRPSGYGLSMSTKEFVERSNREILVCAQLEDRAAIDNVDEILAVPGVDVFFIGPSDLSQSMGYPGERDNPAVKTAIEETLGKIRAAGKIPGMPATADSVSSVAGNGVQYVYTHLPGLLNSAAREFFGAARL